MSGYKIGAAREELKIVNPKGIHLQGFANQEQVSTGQAMKIYARAFVIEDKDTGMLVALCIVDLWSCTAALKTKVLESLEKVDRRFGNQNVHIAGTHTHSAPAGYDSNRLYNYSTGGFDAARTAGFAANISQAIASAFKYRVPGTITHVTGEVKDCGKNRSIEAYNRNDPFWTEHSADTDREMFLLNFRNEAGKSIGILNWYAIHPTALRQYNTEISGDCKGLAALYLEEPAAHDESKGDAETIAGLVADPGSFVAAFGTSNAGDVSGNVGQTEKSHEADRRNMLDLAGKMYAAARTLLGKAGEPVSGPVRASYTEEDMSDSLAETVHVETIMGLKSVVWSGDSQNRYPMEKSHIGALGLSMFAGSREDGEPLAGLNTGDLLLNAIWLREGITDGKGGTITVTERAAQAIIYAATTKFDIIQLGQIFGAGVVGLLTAGAPMAGLVGLILGVGGVAGTTILTALNELNAKSLTQLTNEQKFGHLPKPITVVTHDEVVNPVLPIQVIEIGNVTVLGMPAELTTVAGRMLKHRLEATFREMDEYHKRDLSPHGRQFVLSCYANAYAQYVTTPDEYGAQHYEGASTLFGKYTLGAYAGHFDRLIRFGRHTWPA